MAFEIPVTPKNVPQLLYTSRLTWWRLGICQNGINSAVAGISAGMWGSLGCVFCASGLQIYLKCFVIFLKFSCYSIHLFCNKLHLFLPGYGFCTLFIFVVFQNPFPSFKSSYVPLKNMFYCFLCVFLACFQEQSVQIPSNPPPEQSSIPLLFACTASAKTVVANPLLHLGNLTHDILHAIINLDSPPHPDTQNSKVCIFLQLYYLVC